jgi:DNA repair protein RecN (Recombination protein N)
LSGAPQETGDSDGSATDSIGRAKGALEGSDDNALTVLADQLSEALTLITDVASELVAYLGELPSDASALETKLARQAQLRTLTRKYAADVDGVLTWAQEARERLTQLDVSEEALTALASTVDELASQVATAAAELTKARTKAAKALAKAVTAELSGLAMADAEFTISVQPMPARLDDSAPLIASSGMTTHAGSSGTDIVEFGFAAHTGITVLPVNKSASGGELSRLMLALEVVLSASAEGTTMVFDEVDAGVGGRAAVQIGRRLARLARTHQVIVVTHLPQVAAYADVHLVVDAGGRNETSAVRRLDDDGRVGELARMLAGLGESDTARAHARELLETATGDRRM